MGATDESGPFSDRFAAAIARLPVAGRRVIVALSGGLDSTLLLHLIHRADVAASVAAIHVDHGLQQDSAAWLDHCIELTASLGIALITRRLELEPAAGKSVEEVAREARYAAFAAAIGRREVLLTAHHADDQLETVLLRILRGTGVRGLGAIRSSMAFGDGWLARPLLGFTRPEIEAEATRLGLGWLEDPSNVDTRFDRNFLRAKVLPAVHDRWPNAGPMASRLARQMAEAEEMLGEVAIADLAPADELERLPVDLLASLSGPRQSNALRYAVRTVGLPVPNAAQLAELRRALASRPDATVVVRWPGAEARIYRGALYLSSPASGATPRDGRIDARSLFAFSDGELRLVAAGDYGIPDRWVQAGLEVRFRRGGEQFRPRGSGHRKSLKHWCQEQAIVPWMRGRLPLLFRDGQLVAVADLCLADDLPQAAADGPFWRPVWTGHARLR